MFPKRIVEKNQMLSRIDTSACREGCRRFFKDEGLFQKALHLFGKSS